MNKEDIELLIKKIGVAMYYHKKGMYDYDMLVDYELDYNQWKQLLGYIEHLQQENKELHNKIDEGIDLISKTLNLDYDKFCNYNTYKNSLKEIRSILKDSDTDE